MIFLQLEDQTSMERNKPDIEIGTGRDRYLSQIIDLRSDELSLRNKKRI
mgnify:CR=1 FL=1